MFGPYGIRLLVQDLALEDDFQILVLRLFRAQLPLCIKSLLLYSRVAQDDDDRIRLYRRARAHEDLLHPPVGDRWDPANFLGGERTDTVNLPNHRTAPDCIDPETRAVHGGSRWLEFRHAHRDAGE